MSDTPDLSVQWQAYELGARKFPGEPGSAHPGLYRDTFGNSWLKAPDGTVTKLPGAAGGGITPEDADARYVNTDGDTMTGPLLVSELKAPPGEGLWLNGPGGLPGVIVGPDNMVGFYGHLPVEQPQVIVTSDNEPLVALATALQGIGLVEVSVEPPQWEYLTAAVTGSAQVAVRKIAEGFQLHVRVTDSVISMPNQLLVTLPPEFHSNWDWNVCALSFSPGGEIVPAALQYLGGGQDVYIVAGENLREISVDATLPLVRT